MNNNKNGLVKNSLFYIVIFLGIMGALYYFVGNRGGAQSQQIQSSQFITELKKNNVKEFTMQPAGSTYRITGTYKKPANVEKTGGLTGIAGTSTKVSTFTTNVLTNDTLVKQIESYATKNKVKYGAKEEESSSIWVQLLIYVLPLVFFIFFFYMMMGQAGQGGGNGRGVMSFGKSKAKPVEKKNNKVRFSDVAGAEEEKQELVEVVEFLRDLFENAKKSAPAIIFIDEIDAVGRRRGNGMGGGHDEREQTLNQLLVEMDGFEGDEGVIVMAATNRSDVLDPALLRPGRFDRKILVGRPDVKGREAILKVHAKNKPLAKDVDLKMIAKQTPGFVGADLENLLNEAALLAARRNKKAIDASDIDEAEDRVIAGPAKRDRVISKKERETVAYHEAGHTIVGLVLNDARVVHKVTIVPRGRAGGYAIMLPKEDQMLLSKKDMQEQIAGLMGGRAAEELIFGQQSSGASNDFQQATQLARAMVTEYGMSDQLGPVQYEGQSGMFAGDAVPGQAPFSINTANAIDEEVKRLSEEGMALAKKIIEEHKEQHAVIAKALLEYETLDEKQILSLYKTGKMPAQNEDEFPSEKATATTFEESKEALERKEAAKRESKVADETTSFPSEKATTADKNKTTVFYPKKDKKDTDSDKD